MKIEPEKYVVINDKEAQIMVQSNGIVITSNKVEYIQAVLYPSTLIFFLFQEKKLIPWSYLIGITKDNLHDSCFTIHCLRIINFNENLDIEDNESVNEKEFSIYKVPKLSYKTITVNCISMKLCKTWIEHLETNLKLLGRGT